jgi:dienelactone hydrolase
LVPGGTRTIESAPSRANVPTAVQGKGQIIMGQFINLQAADGFSFPAYVAEPAGKPRGAVVVLQEIFGVTDHIRELCDEYAADGYEVLSPAIFDREHPGFEAAYTGPDYHRAVELARDLHPFAQSLDDAQMCIDVWFAGMDCAGLKEEIVTLCNVS